MTGIFSWEGGDATRGVYPPERAEQLDTNPDVPWEPSEGVVYEGYPNFVRFPTPTAFELDTSAALLEANIVDHGEDDSLGALFVRWGVADADLNRFNWMCVTRSGFGFPQTPNDGTKVFMRRRNEVAPVYDTEAELKLWSLLDSNLQPGHWYYYTLFVKTNPYDWQRIKETSCLVPINYGHGPRLFGMLPPYYQWTDDETYASTDSSVTRRLLNTIGVGLDLLRTETEGIENIYSADLAPMALYRALGEQNFGIKRSTVLGDVRFRRLTARANHLARMRGTPEGLADFVETATQYVTDVTLGRNEMLVSDDSEFTAVPGHWATPSASVAKLLGGQHGPVLDTIRTTSTSIETTYDLDPPVVRTRTPELVLGRGVLKLSPEWDPEDPDAWVRRQVHPRTGVAESPKPALSRLAMSCGIGSKLVQRGVDLYRLIEQNPTLYGIPVVAEKRYHLTFYVAREGSREDSQTGLPIPVSPDVSSIRFGFAWYNRSSVRGNESFNDGFSRNFAGYRSVDPIELTVQTYSPEETEAKVWEYVLGTFTAPIGAEFCTPVIEFDGVDISARYIAAVMVSRENEAGHIVSYGPDIFFRLGHDTQEEDDDVLGGDKVLGDPAQV